MWSHLAVCALWALATAAAAASHHLRRTGAWRQPKSELVFLKSDRNSYTYSFNGFNRSFVLHLEPVDGLLSPSFHVLSKFSNASFEVSNTSYLRTCVSEGFVENDSTSYVTLSTCRGGLTGFIHTCHGDFQIEPTSSEAHLLHLVSERKTCQAADFRKERSKRSISKEWNLELIVVADSKMKKYHGDNLEIYILTLMASVSLIYKDPSIGNNINLSIVKLIIMSEDEDAGIIFPSASKTLRNFCRWQQELKDPYGFHHDTAILLTREDLCRHSRTCDTLGLAQSGMACDRESSCAVVEDNGLSAAFTIAHEIGHILGIPHDDDVKCKRFHKQGQRLHVMARMLDYNSYPWTWSECSRYFITAFLDAGYGHCLLSKSKKDLLGTFEHVGKAAGELYDMDYQCELVFGQGSRICPYMPVCKRLWCTMEDFTLGGCRTQHMPWADGTRCGPDKSCVRGECVPDPVLEATAQDGEWGEWQRYGACSRTCGGGVRRSIRDCDNPRPTNGGRYCVGERIRFKSCNTENCPISATDFREEQCSSFNEQTFGFPGVDPKVKWVPHYLPDAKDSCKLYCRAAGTAAYFLLKERVIDGTKCGPETYDICINGKCEAAGCDHQLGSAAVTDVCGVCGGDGTSCRIVRGASTPANYGYNHVVTIPAGASNIEIVQHGFGDTFDDNYLALLAADEKYILNGNYMISMFPKSIQYAGSLIDYSGSHTTHEKINASKRLEDDMHVQVLTIGSIHLPEVTYKYTVSVYEKVIYRWSLEETWSPCNSICQGEQYRKAICLDKTDGKVVGEELCREHERPTHEAKVCNLECFLKWQVTVVKPCSATCGPGIVSNEVKCLQLMTSGTTHVLPPQACAHIEPRPLDSEPCVAPCKTTAWKNGEWSQCSSSCGGGIQIRKAVCIGDDQIELPESECVSEEKVTEKSCSPDACPSWNTEEWSECSTTCGSGTKRRRVSCPGGQCDSKSRPHSVEQCTHLVSCPKDSPRLLRNSILLPEDKTTVWRAGNWSSCSATCGAGLMYRQVLCVQPAAHERVLPERKCGRTSRPQHVRACIGTSCGRWSPGKWSECSSSCGPGLQSRRVVCVLSSEGGGGDEHCDPRHRPKKERLCNPQPCHQENSVANFYWRTGLWGKCSAPCDGGVRRRQVACYDEHGQLSHSCDPARKPQDTSPCNLESCPQWKLGEWGQCSSACGAGVKTRVAKCHRGRKQVPDKECLHTPKPHSDTKVCKRHKCGYRWRKAKWSNCSTTCGKGHKTRVVTCAVRNTTVSDHFCNQLRKPKIRRRCHQYLCSMTWVTTPWSECSGTCGRGVQRRSISCHHVNAYQWIDPRPQAEDACNSDDRPSETRGCNYGDCDGKVWITAPWTKCSATCGTGRQRRRVHCRNSDGKRLPHTECKQNLKPQRRRRCLKRPCSADSCLDFKLRGNVTVDGEQEIFVHGRYVKIYCHGMNTSQPTEYISLPRGEQDNYSEVYNKRLRRPETCPFAGARFDGCDCTVDESDSLTTFTRIRINITSLEVNASDFSFAQTIGHQAVPLGESGDCYSAASCPQGRFSLSLLGTGFVVSTRTKWVSHGNSPSSRIRWLEGGQVIQGKCGGHCGRCSPEGKFLLEVAPP